jgi:acetyl esterase
MLDVPRLRAQLTGLVARGFFEGLSAAGKLHPLSSPEAHNIEVIRDVRYTPSGHPDHRLDIYRRRDLSEPLPIVLYVHGGGFHLLSKDTHWLMALLFARAGYLVFNISYRLAPDHPFPAAHEDACAALVWLSRNAEAFGGDLDRLVVAGESAGANLAASLSIAACYERPEPYARRVWETGVVPKVAVLGCGILQVSDPGRFTRRRRLPWWLQMTIDDICHGYLGPDCDDEATLADPLLVLEQAERPSRTFPAIYAFVGTKDPILDDTRRLAQVLSRLEVAHQVRYYPGELHAFHALLFRQVARSCWEDKLSFLAARLAARLEALAEREPPAAKIA